MQPGSLIRNKQELKVKLNPFRQQKLPDRQQRIEIRHRNTELASDSAQETG